MPSTSISVPSTKLSLPAGGAIGTSFLGTRSLSARSNAFHTVFSTWLNVDAASLGAALTVFGTVTGMARALGELAPRIYWWFTTLFAASISIDSNDRLNKEILGWLESEVLLPRGARTLTASTETVQSSSRHPADDDDVIERNDILFEKRAPIRYLPIFGVTWFIFDRNFFLVRRVSANSRKPPSPEEKVIDDRLIIMCLGRSVTPIKNFLDTCRDFTEKQRESFTIVHTNKAGYDRFDSTILKPIRTMETVHFDEKIKAELIADIKNYLSPNNRRFYMKRGIPYRRGYLLHGPPGTGKTSLSSALAGYFGLELYLIHIPTIRSDHTLDRLFTALPPICLVLLEDIDAVGLKRDPTEDEELTNSSDNRVRRMRKSTCTLSGLLNVLDGVTSQTGRIVLMTSNFADMLDEALIRPGRVDKQVYLGHISQSTSRLMFLGMFSRADDDIDTSNANLEFDDEKLGELASTFSTEIPEDTFTPAQLQEFLVTHRDSPVNATAEISAWVKEEIARKEEAELRAEKEKTRKTELRHNIEARLRPMLPPPPPPPPAVSQLSLPPPKS